jgi:hypothetical protein
LHLRCQGTVLVQMSKAWPTDSSCILVHQSHIMQQGWL